MEIPKLIILLCCTYCLASDHPYSHTIPVENYETELQVLDQHVEIPEPPVKIIKVTKTVAIKIPVPYPVKVVEKVPYPVHVAKPYPVPVPQIVHVPHSGHNNIHKEQEHGALKVQDLEHFQQHKLEENFGHKDEQSFSPISEHSFGGGNSDYTSNFGGSDHSSDEGYGPPFNYQGYANDRGDTGTLESRNYNVATKQYPRKDTPNNGHYSNIKYH